MRRLAFYADLTLGLIQTALFQLGQRLLAAADPGDLGGED